MKQCKGCGLLLPFCDYHKDKGTKDGYRGKCKGCVRIYKQVRQLLMTDEKREFERDYQKKYRIENKEELKRKEKDWRNRNKEKVKSKKIEWAQNNRDSCRISRRNYDNKIRHEVSFVYAKKMINRRWHAGNYVPPELVEVERLRILIKRFIKEN